MRVSSSSRTCSSCHRHLPRAAPRCPWCATPAALPSYRPARSPARSCAESSSGRDEHREATTDRSPLLAREIEAPRRLLQYGALPWRVGRCGNVRTLLITSRRRGRWIVPKGWLERGTSPTQSAAREAYEEAGVIGKIHATPLGRYSYLKQRDDGSSDLCDVSLFGLRVRGTLINWPEKGQRQRRWCTLAEASELVDEPQLKQLLKSVEKGSTALR